MDKVVEDFLKKYSKFEKTRIIGARALQLSMNAPFLTKISKKKLEELNYDPVRIAAYEYEKGVVPLVIKRPLPGNRGFI